MFGADSSRLLKLEHWRGRDNIGFVDDEEYDARYVEGHVPGTVGYYGMTKLAGENAILHKAAEDHDFKYWIIRTAGLFEYPRRRVDNFMWKIASRLQGREPVKVVSDVFTSLCYVPQLSQAIAWMVDHRFQYGAPDYTVCVNGTYHVANTGSASWYEVASYLAVQLGKPTAQIVPCRLSEYLADQRRELVWPLAITPCLTRIATEPAADRN